MTILPRLDAEPSLCFTALTLQEFANSIISATKEEDAKICDEMAEREDANFQQEFALDLAAQAIRESKP